jgi:hypothetical protein
MSENEQTWTLRGLLRVMEGGSMSENELDSLMRQADIANQEARERGSMSKHTPGPWSAELFEGESVGWIDGLDPCHYLLNKEGERFALVSTPTNPETLVSGSDIRLIAAAPETKRQRDELLEALEFVRSELSSECGDRGEEHGLRSALMGIIRAIDEAIANATKEEA